MNVNISATHQASARPVNPQSPEEIEHCNSGTGNYHMCNDNHRNHDYHNKTTKVLATGTIEMIYEHLHAQATPDHSATVQGLHEAWDEYS